MNQKPAVPATMVEAIRYFADPDISLTFLAALRWPDGQVVCPQCGSREVTFLREYRRWKCRTKHPRQQFSIKVGTIFEDSPIGLDKWLAAVWMIANDKNGISSYEVARGLGVTQKSAWFMLHRIRLAMQDGSVEKLRGQVEADETFIGGHVRNMHTWRRRKVMEGRKGGSHSKAVVMGLLERGGRVRATVLPKAMNPWMRDVIDKNVESGTELITDAASMYRTLSPKFLHSFVDHIQSYVRGHIHTQGLENFWSLLKRALHGTYVSVEPFHLHRYVDEEAFRYNERFGKDADRFVTALRGIIGRRITYKTLTGAVATT
ncbi:MAG TPA: IS1595 family transposase [Methylomirabilota bacterium]|jgi:transposase-like protein